jgi:hypothetical protein
MPGYLPACDSTEGFDFAVAKLEDFEPQADSPHS